MATSSAVMPCQEREEILSAIAEAQRQKEVGEKTRAAAQVIIAKFAGQQEENLSPEEIELWRQASADINNSNILIRMMDGNLAKYRSDLKQYDTTATTMSAGVASSPHKKRRDSGKSSSSASSRSKLVELEAEESLLMLEEKFNQRRLELQDRIDDREKIMKRATDDAEKERLLNEIEDLRTKLKRCERDNAAAVAVIKRREEIQKKKISAEMEEEQNVDSDGDNAVDHVNNWLVDQNANAGERYDTPRGSVVLPPQAVTNQQQHPHPLQQHHSQVPQVQQQFYHQQRTVHQSPGNPHHPPRAPTVNPIADLTSALKNAFREVRGDKEWEPRDLPIFNGKAEDWPIFSGEFWRTTPHGKVNSSQNAIRLRKSLKGSALDAVVGLINEPNNVNRIMQILEERFGRKELVIRALIAKVEQCKSPDITKPDSFVSFGTVVQHLVETVKSLKEERYLNDMTLLDKLVQKLPTLYATEWISWIRAKPYLPQNLESFGHWVDEKISVLVCLVTPIIKEENTNNRNSRPIRGSAKVNAAVTEEPTQKAEPRKEKEKCACCDRKSHKIAKCWSFQRRPVDERIKLVKEHGLCFRCLGGDHQKRNCTSNIICDQSGCSREHHPLLHFEGRAEKQEKRIESPPPQQGEKEPVQSGSGGVASSIGVVQSAQSRPLSIVKVRVRGPKGIRRVYAMLDNGTDTTLIDAKLANELGLVGKEVRHKCQVFGGVVTSSVSKVINFEIAGCFKSSKFYSVQDAIAKENWVLAPYSQDAKAAKVKWPHLRKAKLENFSGVIPQIMIGEDYPALAAHREILERSYDDPIAKRTFLGWVIGGRKLRSGIGSAHINAVSSMEEDDRLERLLKNYFSLDSYGSYPKNVLGSVEDKKAAEMMARTVRKTGSSWECALLWKDDSVKLKESRTEAVKRLLSNERRLSKDPIAFQLYHEKMDEYVKKGYMKELTPTEANERSDRTLYIPHFAVFNVNKPGKIRVVFDATCANGGESLNRHLYSGPDLIRPLPTVMLNFRTFNIALNGDIEEMYHRVTVRPEDRNSQRFVWRDLRSPAENKSIRDFCMNVLLFGASCSQAIAIYAKDKNAEMFAKDFPEAVLAIKEHFYSDDCLSGAQTPQDAIKLVKEITQICAAGNFHIKKWLSNSKQVIQAIPEEDRAVGLKGFTSKEEIPPERVLGLWWNPDNDEFTFSANFKKVDPELLAGRRPTKREMCRLLMSIFDPLGFIANFRIKGLILLQRTWLTGVDWDDEIPDNIYVEWQVWVNRLKETEGVKVPRCYAYDIHLATNIQLHTLVDASEEATSSVSYLRIQMGEKVTLAFVFGKTKVAPIKKLTIPRLELTAAVMGACQADNVTQELRVPITKRFFWSDSRTVLKWIRSQTQRHKEFVANRVSRIQTLTTPGEWKWVPTELNVADQGTRLKSVVDLSTESLWLIGPEFLREQPDTWPVEDAATEPPEEEIELRSKINVVRHLGDPLGVSVSTDEACGLSGGENTVIVDFKRYSDYVRMVRAQAGVFRAARHWLKKTRKEVVGSPWKQDHVISSIVSPEEFRQAEEMLIRAVQLECFEEDIATLIKTGSLHRTSKLWKLTPFLENGILKMRGRISLAVATNEMKTPIILPARHHFTELLVLKEHERNAHQGQATVLGNLRRRFWIIEGRAAVRRAVRNCQVCRLANAKPIIPRMGDLPSYRLAAGTAPFAYTGVDLMGPVEVTVGRHREKRWIAVFTCMVMRAVHLEIVYGLSTDETMMALSRFIATRGRPRCFHSDNGTNFVGAKKELREAWKSIDWNVIRNADKFREIQWDFTPPRSPHFGGAWERMVQAVKKILKRTLSEKNPKDQTLWTMVKGAEAIINDRPLSYASDDHTDSEPLTPNHFLRGFADVGPVIPGSYESADESRRAQWRRAQAFMEQFWDRWRKEVLPELARREKWCRDSDSLQVGDVVLLIEDNAPRNTWMKGIIVETYPGKDGQVRVVKVETADSKTAKRHAYKRGVEKVIPLGLRTGKSVQDPDFGGRDVVESQKH